MYCLQGVKSKPTGLVNKEQLDWQRQARQFQKVLSAYEIGRGACKRSKGACDRGT